MVNQTVSEQKARYRNHLADAPLSEKLEALISTSPEAWPLPPVGPVKAWSGERPPQNATLRAKVCDTNSGSILVAIQANKNGVRPSEERTLITAPHMVGVSVRYYSKWSK